MRLYDPARKGRRNPNHPRGIKLTGNRKVKVGNISLNTSFNRVLSRIGR